MPGNSIILASMKYTYHFPVPYRSPKMSKSINRESIKGSKNGKCNKRRESKAKPKTVYLVPVEYKTLGTCLGLFVKQRFDKGNVW